MKKFIAVFLLAVMPAFSFAAEHGLELDKADIDLTDKAAAGISAAADRVKAGKAKTVTLTGHTDSTGADAYNLALSKRRADAVKGALTPLLPGVTINASGKGEAEPVASNDNAAGQALNRRVSIVFEEGK